MQDANSDKTLSNEKATQYKRYSMFFTGCEIHSKMQIFDGKKTSLWQHVG